MKRIVASAVILVLGMVVGVYTGQLGAHSSLPASERGRQVPVGTNSAEVEKQSPSPASRVAAAASPPNTTLPASESPYSTRSASSMPTATPVPPASASTVSTPGGPSATPAPTLTQEGEPYIIQPGDTLARIAKRLGVDVEVLFRLNPGVRPEALEVGQTITIPRQSPAVLPAPPSATPVPTRTSTPAPTDTPRSTATARPSPTPSPTAPQLSPTIAQLRATVQPSSATVILQQVAQAEAAVRTGRFDVAINYGDRTRSVASILFDLGDGRREPRLHIITTYESAEGTQAIERITIGNRSWERQPDNPWVAKTEEEGVWAQVQAFLPHAGSVSDAEIGSGGNTALLHWYAADRHADVTLQADPVTHIPRELRQVTRGTNTVLTVIYSGWNTAVEISPPAES
ncbi:MAG: LysM peptidoglycan-binding domain-containing protein [Ardenticatenaceae bacterium]|nr:LysM peptidoglycan-binding domain-containing protein [Ardenticatenaceae bacterium]